MSILRAHQLSKSYKQRRVVQDVSLEVGSGKIVGLLGPNGAGKTTSFYMTVGLINPDQGHVFLDDHDLTHLPLYARARLGISYLPQEASVFRKLSVEDNILSVLEWQPQLTPGDREKKLEQLLQEFHLTGIRKTLGLSLSGGERRRVEIARSLATKPRFILLDEPFAGVDPISVIDIKKSLQHLKEKGIGLLITDHNVRDTLDICETAYIVNEGRILAKGTPEAILTNTQVREVYLGDDFA